MSLSMYGPERFKTQIVLKRGGYVSKGLFFIADDVCARCALGKRPLRSKLFFLSHTTAYIPGHPGAAVRIPMSGGPALDAAESRCTCGAHNATAHCCCPYTRRESHSKSRCAPSHRRLAVRSKSGRRLWRWCVLHKRRRFRSALRVASIRVRLLLERLLRLNRPDH